MSIEKKIKKAIVQEWNIEFPDLSQFAQNRLYKVLGPIVGGIEIFNLTRSEDYRPYIVWYPLWKLDLKECFKETIIMYEMKNKKGLQYDIPYKKNDEYFYEVVLSTKQQLCFPFSGNVNLKDLFKLIDSQFSHTLVKSSPTGQAKLFETKILGALYVNDEIAIKQVWAEIYKISKTWLPNLFEWKYGKLNVWLESLQTIISNRDEFLRQIEVNRQDTKISQLKSSELIA